MANILKREKQVAAISGLAEGLSIRSVERMTGIHRDTIMRLGVRVGQGCTTILDEMMHDIRADYFELDELWGFVGKKQRRVKPTDGLIGDAWTFVALEAESKAVPVFRVGKRDAETAQAFVADLSSRLANRVQISTDGMAKYVEAIEKSFGPDVDYAQIVKSYASNKPLPGEQRYSPPKIKSLKKQVISGMPEPKRISTSYVERSNLTTRMHCRRLTRLTNAFSKKWENLTAAVGLHFGYYNLVKMHISVKMTPAMALGVTPSMWTVHDLVDRALEATA
jgi:IS1 family transposase